MMTRAGGAIFTGKDPFQRGVMGELDEIRRIRTRKEISQGVIAVEKTRNQALPEQKTTAKATTQMTKYQKTMTDYMRDMRDYQQQEARRRQFADLR